MKQLLTEGVLGFSVLRFRLIFGAVFRFSELQTVVFRFSCHLRFAVFPLFSNRFSIFGQKILVFQICSFMWFSVFNIWFPVSRIQHEAITAITVTFVIFQHTNLS